MLSLSRTSKIHYLIWHLGLRFFAMVSLGTLASHEQGNVSRKIMFSVASVSQSFCLWVPCHHYPWCIGSHHGTSLYCVPDLPLQVTPGGQDWRPVQTCSPKRTPAPVLTPGGQDRRPVQMCSLRGSTTRSISDIWWLLKDVQLASRRYTSYSNTVLFITAFFHKLK